MICDQNISIELEQCKIIPEQELVQTSKDDHRRHPVVLVVTAPAFQTSRPNFNVFWLSGIKSAKMPDLRSRKEFYKYLTVEVSCQINVKHNDLHTNNKCSFFMTLKCILGINKQARQLARCDSNFVLRVSFS